MCDECKDYLVKKKDSDKNIWPSFMWNILSGSTKSKFVGNKKYYTKYNAEVLWRLIPNTMRPWWIDSIQTIDEETN